MHPQWWRLEQRGKLDWTKKARLLYGVSLILLFGIAGLVYISVSWRLFFALLLGMLLALPIIVIVASWLVAPVEVFLKRRIVLQAQEIMSQSPTKVIGITGSFGKTSMKEILAILLEGSFVVIKTPENINTDLGVAEFIRSHAREIATAEIFIVEMGAHRQGDIQSLCNLVQPDYSILTGIGESHIERFGGLTNIIKTKFELPRATRMCTILNGDNRYIHEANQELSALACETVEVSTQVLRDASIPLDDFSGLRFEWEGEQFTTQLLGRHNISLFILGMTLARRLGVPIEHLRERITKVAPVEHRLQPIHNAVTDVWVLDDSYNGNREGALSAVEVLARARGRRLVLTPGLVELGDVSEEVHRALAEAYIRIEAEILLIQSPMTRYIEEYCLEHAYAHYRVYANTSAAHADLSRVLRRGDTILFQNDLTDNYF
jgi:UDP-N-acetylmuramoyl-tripeptide--D-alanyl-D-alanine ligase